MLGYTSVRHMAVVCHILTRVLQQNPPLVKFIRICIRDPSGVFSISSAVKDINDVISCHCVARLPNFARWRAIGKFKRFTEADIKSYTWSTKMPKWNKKELSIWDSNIKFISSRHRVISSIYIASKICDSTSFPGCDAMSWQMNPGALSGCHDNSVMVIYTPGPGCSKPD